MLLADSHHIIAIGANAGGMEEIFSFFDHSPSDGVSYVVVQHLSLAYKSRMIEMLTKHSKLRVREAEDGMLVEKNEVYLIPVDKSMIIRENKLLLSDRLIMQPQLTINHFFDSLALDSGSRAIGVVLSGHGADGTEGIRSIKKAGGMVIARDPETTEFSGMPFSAIATGLVDFILEPVQIPQAIEEYIRYGGELLSDEEDGELITLIIQLIRDHSPLDFSEYKYSTILRRTKRRAAFLNFKSLGTYLEFLKASPTEVETLAKDYLISVTSFFRDPEAFKLIEEKVIPELLKNLAPCEELKLWVAGCATGEEVYSLAIIIAEQLTGEHKDRSVKIFATDIDNIAIAHAGKGIYNAAISRHIPADRLETYFTKEGDQYRVKHSIRKMTIFAYHDLVKNPPYCNMHFIICRNLLIYMTPVLQKKVFTMLLFGLKMDGYLFLGSSESPVPIMRNLQVIDKKWKIYKNLEAKRGLRLNAFSLPELLDIKHAPELSKKDDLTFKAGTNLDEAISLALVTELECLVICIDDSNRVMKTYGDTTKYILQKNFTADLTKLLPKPLAVAFNTLKNKVIETNDMHVFTGIKVQTGQKLNVDLSISLLPFKSDAPRYFMVRFSETAPVAGSNLKTSQFDEKVYLNQYTNDIERDLKDLQAKLSASYEQLDSTSENMQTYNEELLLAYEEMQSANEEIQSVNEELDAININYQSKNKELLESNDDLNNYFRSNINGQLFINNKLELMKFSPGTVKLINLLETDIGRPIGDISTNIRFETIIEDIKQVLAEGSVITKEIEANNGKWYQIMTMPYIQQEDNKSIGAIITFNDITELKKTQTELEGLLKVNADLDNFVHVASHDLLAPLGSIEGSINVINKMTLTDPELSEFLNIINISIRKFRALIQDISTIARVEGDMIAMIMVDLNEIINDVEWSLDLKIKFTDAKIIRNLEIKHVFFSKKNLRSIIYNLVSNAIKFKGEDAPLIIIHARKDGDHIIITVQDNGMGIPEDKQELIFNLYGRINQEIEGHGIGLYLAHKMVNSAGGTISVDSTVGQGTTFTLKLRSTPVPLKVKASLN